ncbi:MAG: ATP-grasp domain-containing protein [Nitrososphaeria archaeon]|nr:ATP-grasp domain-containing protein [Nitrosopumilaceae archaeon]NIP10042.1 ATP-grasp domain-containing protein [Nitrosopumilaceae archaeon]NIP91019.1 ATP-grasp domain-containing protein [Nitrososphaeria archaeon]NIS94838.1 ATP-grasp domain-containing protein [Nitrosopumilaceae archaeon]
MKVAIVYNKKTIDENDVINIFGTTTKEHYSLKTVEKVAKALEKAGHSVKIIEGGMGFIDEMKDFMPKVVSGDTPGMVFNMAYGIQGKNRYTHVPAMLEMLGLPYVGSGPEAHSVVQDKVMTKIVLQKNHIPTPGFWVFSSSEDKFDDVIFPVIVKPSMESTSMGMKIVDNWEDLKKTVQEQLEKYSQDILAEQFIPGREFAVGLIGNGSNIEVFPIVEIDLKGDPNKIQTKSDKMKTPLDKICPAKLTKEQETEIKKICLQSFRKLGLNDYARVDLRMDEKGNVYILELNSMASLGLTGSYVHAAITAGYSFDSLINKILDVSALRYFGESHLHPHEASPETIESQPLRSVIRSHLRSHLTSNERLLEQLVNVNSSVHNIDNVNRLGDTIIKRLENLGFHSQDFHEFDVGNIVYLKNHDSENNEVLLLSHLDTWYENRDFTPYYKVGNKLYGSGIAESKGGILLMISALQALRFARKLKKIKCGILLISDDSLGGKYSKKLVHDISNISNYVIDLKWGTKEGSIATSCSGITKYHIDMVHVRRPNETIKEVIPDMCHKVILWKKISQGIPDARITISDFSGQTSYGKAPDYGKLSLESRYVNIEQGKKFDAEIRKIAKKKTNSNLDIHVAKTVTRQPFIKTEKIENFYEIIQKLAKLAEIKIKPEHRFAPSSLCDVLADIPMIGSMGPLGSDHRTANEHIFRDSLIDRGVLLSLTINKCSALSREAKK